MLVFHMKKYEEDNDAVFERLYNTYADDVFRRVLRILKNKQDAEDAMQNTWKSVAENISFFRAKTDISIRAYLLRIARNQAITIFRERQKEEKYFSDEDIMNTPDDFDVESRLLNACAKTEADNIHRCLRELSEPYRDVLILFYFHQNSTKEIAKLMNMNENTVRTRLSRGRERLLRLLERREAYDGTGTKRT